MESTEMQSERPHLLQILSHEGDKRYQWNKMDPEQIALARAGFEEHLRKGYAAFKVNAAGDKGEQITAFDPTAERMIVIPPLRGG